ncbi:MAG: TetR family transcriptional regulator, partial [Nostoc sp.]
MSKGEETKSRILYQAAELFNQQGYAGSSMSDIMRVTGLQKGGIYNHFQSKDDLAL